MTGAPAPTTRAKRRKPKAPRFNPRESRPGETIGGGFLVFRRGKTTGRVAMPTTLPFEHGSEAEALAEAGRLAQRHPRETFQVFQASHCVRASTGEPEA